MNRSDRHPDRPDPVTQGPRGQRSILDALPDGVIGLDASGAIESANRAFLTMVGSSHEQAIGRPIESFLADEDALSLVGVVETFRSSMPHESNILFKDGRGSVHSLIVNAAKADDDGWFLTLRERGAVQRELAHTTRWAAEEQDRADELHTASEALKRKNAALNAAQAELREAHEVLRQQVETQKRLEDELRLAQKLESIGQLAAGIAHEINTPMQYVGDNVAFVDDSFKSIAEHLARVTAALVDGRCATIREARALIDASADDIGLDFLVDQVPQALVSTREGIVHVSGIVRAMKSFSRPDSSEKATVDLNQGIRDTLLVAQNEYKSHATIELDLHEISPVMCFPGQLNQVVLNLVVNAAHAIADARRPTLGVIRVSTRERDGMVEISVSDDGCGIPEEIASSIFNPFFTTKEVGRGSGQGLSLSRAIVVDAHGGTLTFESRVGEGTTFTARLPRDGGSRLAERGATVAAA